MKSDEGGRQTGSGGGGKGKGAKKKKTKERKLSTEEAQHHFNSLERRKTCKRGPADWGWGWGVRKWSSGGTLEAKRWERGGRGSSGNHISFFYI